MKTLVATIFTLFTVMGYANDFEANLNDIVLVEDYQNESGSPYTFPCLNFMGEAFCGDVAIKDPTCAQTVRVTKKDNQLAVMCVLPNGRSILLAQTNPRFVPDYSRSIGSRRMLFPRYVHLEKAPGNKYYLILK